MSDCGTALPVCDMGACRKCQAHAECASGACTETGECAAAADIAYVDPTGGGTSDCTQSAPCGTVARALSRTPARQYVVIKAGTYSSASELAISGRRELIGIGATRPVLKRTSAGPIITVTGGVEVSFDHIEISGATSNGMGYGIYALPTGGGPSLTFRDAVVQQNADGGVFARNTTFVANESTFSKNGNYGVEIIDSNATIDRCMFTENKGGLVLDSGLLTLTNSIIARNVNTTTTTSSGLSLYSENPGNRVEFNTIVDNSDATSTGGVGFNCQMTVPASFPNNIIARNKQQTAGQNCSYPSSVIVDNDIAAIAFKSGDTAPYDYHLTAGSIAIDAATLSTVGHDFDGQARPNGNGRDVGADEFYP